jgi:N-acetylglucosaminyldiphosphoundecaprenol N-acetyl-beta-D-mannosaminyltransferase
MEKVNFLGLSISILTKETLIKYLINNVENNYNKICYGYYLGTVAFIDKMPEIHQYGEKFDLFVTDGRIFYLLAKFHGLKLKYDISIPNLVNLTLYLANENKWSVYLLGAKQEVNDKAKTRIRNLYPHIAKIEGHHGYFGNDYLDIMDDLMNNEFNIVLIGITSPLKEKLAFELREERCGNIIIPCGGMIDVLSGNIKQAPNWAKKMGLATLYRLSQEPFRLFNRYAYIYTKIFLLFLPKYVYNVVLCKNKSFSIINK